MFLFWFEVTSIIFEIGDAQDPDNRLLHSTEHLGEPINRVTTLSLVECGDICVLLDNCSKFLFRDAADKCVDPPNNKTDSFGRENDKWNCLFFDSRFGPQDGNEKLRAVDRDSFKQNRCLHLSDSLISGHAFLMRQHGKTLFLGNSFSDRRAWRRTRGSLLTHAANATVRFRSRDVCLGWRRNPDFAQFHELVLERCVDDLKYAFQYLNLALVDPHPEECKWTISSEPNIRYGPQIESKRIKIHEDQTCELEPYDNSILTVRFPDFNIIGEGDAKYPWNKLLFGIETRLSLGICDRNDTVVTNGKVLPEPFNAPFFLHGDTITITCNDGTTMENGMTSLVIICGSNRLHSFGCTKSKYFIIYHVIVQSYEHMCHSTLQSENQQITK